MWAALSSDSDSLGDEAFFAEGEDALMDLVEWVYLHAPSTAQRRLRAPLRLSRAPNPFEQALIKVAAKRWRLEERDAIERNARAVNRDRLHRFRVDEIAVSSENYTQSLGKKFTNLQDAAQWLHDAVASLKRERLLGAVPRRRQDRPVVAALFDREWRLLAAHRNTNAVVRTRHAEINLLDGVKTHLAGTTRHDEPLTLIVSLQCCRMCASAIANSKEKLKVPLRVYYLEKEPTLARVTTALSQQEIFLSVD